MDFYKTTAAFGATACLLMASTALGDAIKSETFELNEGGWVGGTNRVTATYSAPSVAGLPISASIGDGNHVLEIVGSATNTISGATAGDALVDMMVKVSVPDSALDGLDAEGARFAVAVDTVANATTGQFKYYNGAAWVPVSTDTSLSVYADGAWVRLTMKFYYDLGKCVVALNGDTCGTFDLLERQNDESPKTLASIEVKGATALDEVLVTKETMVAAFSGSDTIGNSIVTKKWLTAFNKTWPETASADLISQYTLGLDPNGTATTMPLSFEQNGDNDKVTLSFPGFGAFGGDGAYYLDSSPDNSNWTSGTTALTVSGTGVNTATVNFQSFNQGQAVYYRVRAASN